MSRPAVVERPQPSCEYGCNGCDYCTDYGDEDPHPDYPCRHDGRCQYAIDHGAEGMGHCPRGKCVMANERAAQGQGDGR